jgi:hypothetical protein
MTQNRSGRRPEEISEKIETKFGDSRLLQAP